MNEADKKLAKDITADEALEILFSLGAFLGSSIGGYGRTFLHITFKGDEEREHFFPDDADVVSSAEHGSIVWKEVPETKKTAGRSSEDKSLSAQIAQILTLLHPQIKKAFGSSAIYGILSTAATAFGREGDTVEAKINGMPFSDACRAWIAAKRVFAVRHPEDAHLMICELTDHPDGFPEGYSVQLSGMTSVDERDVIGYCKSLIAEAAEDKAHKEIETSQFPDSLQGEITQLIRDDNIYFPSAEAFRRQDDFALAATKKTLSVGGNANITAKITAPDGKSPIVLTAFDMEIEAAIGEAFMKNGFKTMTLTPAQIYRTFAKMDSGAAVSEDKIQATIKSMDKLLTTPATLDFTEQIEKHTRMKRRKGFDYNDTKRIGTLITGVHDQKSTKTYNGRVVTDTFTIHELPMFFAYSYAIGQMYTVQAKYLTGTEPADPEALKKLPGKKIDGPLPERSSIDDTVLQRWLLKYIKFQENEKEKRDLKLKRHNKEIPKTFEFYLPFDLVERDGLRTKLSEKSRRTLRAKVYDFLELQVKMGNIKYREYYKKGRALHGIKVKL